MNHLLLVCSTQTAMTTVFFARSDRVEMPKNTGIAMRWSYVLFMAGSKRYKSDMERSRFSRSESQP